MCIRSCDATAPARADVASRLAAAALATALVSGCSGGDGSDGDGGTPAGGEPLAGAPSAPTPASPVPPPATPAPAPLGAATGAELLFDDVFEPEIADLSSVAGVLKGRVLAAGAAALVAVNRGYASGTLDPEALECLVSDWPTTGYFCGEAVHARAVRTELAGVVAFDYAPTEACTTGLSENADAPRCTARFVEAAFPDASYARYRLRLVEGAVVETLESSFGEESLVGPELDDSLCVARFVEGEPVSFSDEAICDARLRAALR